MFFNQFFFLNIDHYFKAIEDYFYRSSLPQKDDRANRWASG
jgi:hypothetical protein